jgi:excisionase family DNA binding protein
MPPPAGTPRADVDLPSRSRREWMTLDEFCAALGVHRSTAYKWSAAGTASGRFPRFCRLPNGHIRIRRDWLEEWLDGLQASAS